MTEDEFLAQSGAFLSGDMHLDKMPVQEIDNMLFAAEAATAWADRVKRGLYYGSDVPLRSDRGPCSLNLPEPLKDLFHGCLGAFCEAGELMEHMHGVLTGRAELDTTNLLEEVGDIEWYLACIHRFLGTLPSQAWDSNIRKLATRYNQGRFDKAAAESRDLAAERSVLDETVHIATPMTVTHVHGTDIYEARSTVRPGLVAQGFSEQEAVAGLEKLIRSNVFEMLNARGGA